MVFAKKCQYLASLFCSQVGFPQNLKEGLSLLFLSLYFYGLISYYHPCTCLTFAMLETYSSLFPWWQTGYSYYYLARYATSTTIPTTEYSLSNPCIHWYCCGGFPFFIQQGPASVCISNPLPYRLSQSSSNRGLSCDSLPSIASPINSYGLSVC